MRELQQSSLTERIIGVYFDVYNELGHGFLESVYQAAMLIALGEAGLDARSELEVPVTFRGHQVGIYRADIVVEQRIVVELKAARAIEAAHEAQLLHYLRATPFEVGLLLNFGAKPEFRRLVFQNSRKKIRVNPRKSAASFAVENS
jgi:GxxExxY protein